MPRIGGPSGRAKAAVTAVSGGLLAMIWSSVWYAAVASGRADASPRVLIVCQAIFAAGLAASVAGFIYLRRRRLSVIDGSTTHVPLPPASDPPAGPVALAQQVRV